MADDYPVIQLHVDFDGKAISGAIELGIALRVESLTEKRQTENASFGDGHRFRTIRQLPLGRHLMSARKLSNPALRDTGHEN